MKDSSLTTETHETFVENLTVELMGIPSINGTDGEVEIIHHLEDRLKKLAYFQNKPDLVWTQKFENDYLNRKNLFALVKGQKEASQKTVILHAHCDTVTVEDFGALEEGAYNPSKLMKSLDQLDLPDEVKEDLHSGDWLFGRGSVDMKSGIAAHFWVLKYLSERVEEFAGNVLFMINPIEETTHGGVIEAVPELERIQEELHLHFVNAINTDFTGPLYQGDKSNYFYLGSVGKLLPAFLIRGKETHVGQPFEGLDPNHIASELFRNIQLNPNLSDYHAGELTPPPTALKMRDLKPTYNVQTPIESFLYFNYFVHGNSPDKVMDQLRSIAEASFEKVVYEANNAYRKYCKKNNMAYTPLPWKPNVTTFSELYAQELRRQGPELTERLQEILETYAGKEDPREVTRRMVQEVLNSSSSKDPVVVIFFCTPYVPRNYVKGKNDNEKKLLGILNDITSQDGNIKILNFFPFLSDSSYLALDDTKEEIEQLIANFPGMEKLYPVPVDKIRKLDIPAITMGVYGKDAHKFTERVYKPYSFEKLPILIRDVVVKVLGNEST
ncbi:M20/M25/M40 family metallo-hydrolase [Virgibacillus oceani]